jgi:hypothetical protein
MMSLQADIEDGKQVHASAVALVDAVRKALTVLA